MIADAFPTLGFSPLLPPAVLAGLAVAALAVCIAAAIRRGLWSGLLRGVAMALLIGALANPALVSEEREPLNDIVVAVTDRSASQKLGPREAQTTAVSEAVARQIGALPGIELRRIEVAEGEGGDGTRLFGALSRALADVPAERVAGAILITDGVVHDIPASVNALGFTAPLHALVTGERQERDRRVALVDAPRFGIVGRSQTIRVLIDERGGPGTARLTVRRDGTLLGSVQAPAGRPAPLSIPIEHPGPNVLELEVEPLDGELTAANNRAVLTIEGVRDKLRVLLVSGEPHPGERTWRNLLKSDANVDLVHFTILRPPEKQDGTPINELSLIAFPTRALFQERIQDFDLIIFDRYANLTVLPPIYYDNIADYVRQGGALLLAAGPEFSGASSVARTSLGAILPATPDGRIHETDFRPHVTATGGRHPVTRDLPGGASAGTQASWGTWLRQIGAHVHGGETLMDGADNLPLLILSRHKRGRIALLLSDHAWLWARGFQGGGPHVDLLRRLSHWLMREPALEEEALRATAHDGFIAIERQTMADAPAPVTLTAPDGQTQTVTLTPVKPGLFSATVENRQLGLYRLTDGTLSAFVNAGPDNPRELTDVFSDTQRLTPLAQATGGSVRRVDGAPAVPRIELVHAGSTFAGDNWIGLRPSGSAIVRGVREFPLGIGLAGLALLIWAVLAAWIMESRRRKA
ncbi:hypothetical protein FHS82_001542 [Pseudochelatococcus lubricantis]|uniref:Glutamine amidotransferase domain-containing protein n=1 Tax=Pseudochelatococcus lubricantis TaxID=1538102 RepID=A0ABX0UXP8_9HYPH|nr:hypothetical protein [Pseudochelatococcus lubricantis]NIJ57706.1 hypothetical protein [Pseudochelatococcus lubricantis]